MTPRTRRFLWVWGPALAQMAVIFAASSIPNLGALPGGVSDKSGHSVGYGMLGALLLRALAYGRMREVPWRAGAVTIVLATLYGVSDEFHQSFVPGRSPDVYDVAADLVGASLGVAVTLVICYVMRARSRGPDSR